jgi:hypothetical protein
MHAYTSSKSKDVGVDRLSEAALYNSSNDLTSDI